MKDTIAHNLDQHEKAFQRASIRNSGKEDPAITRRFAAAREVSGANGITSSIDTTASGEAQGISESEITTSTPEKPKEVNAFSGQQKAGSRTGEAWSGVDRILKGQL